MPDPVLRIPVDDAAFKRYLEMFQRYQDQLGAQPEMWQETNEAVGDGIAANLALADAIGAAVSAAVRLGIEQDRNTEKTKRAAQEEEANAQRASDWRRKSLDHVQELSRATTSVVRGFASFATGGGGGLFGGISSIGKTIGGPIGGIVDLAGHVLNAGYEINNAVSDKGQFARGIGTDISGQEGFHNNLGRYVNTDQGMDAIMNARGSADGLAPFYTLGVDYKHGTDAEVLARVYRAQTALAKRHLNANGGIKFYETDPRGGSAFGTSHEDLNRLVHAKDLDKAIQDAVSFKSPLDKQIDAATKSAVATDNFTTKLMDAVQSMGVGLDPALDKATKSLLDLFNAVEKVVGFFNGKAFEMGASSAGGKVGVDADAKFRAAHPWLAALHVHWGDDAPATGVTHGVSTKGGSGAAMPNKSSSSKPASARDVNAFKDIAAYLQGAGMSEAAAFGAAEGAIAESHGDPFSIGPMTKQGRAIGIGQWLSKKRRDNLFAMAAADHVNPLDRKEQLKFLAWELQHGNQGGSGVIHAKSIDSALHAYVYEYMRPEGSTVGRDHPGSEAQKDMQRGRSIGSTANVHLHVKVTPLPGHQTAIVANGAAQGGA